MTLTTFVEDDLSFCNFLDSSLVTLSWSCHFRSSFFMNLSGKEGCCLSFILYLSIFFKSCLSFSRSTWVLLGDTWSFLVMFIRFIHSSSCRFFRRHRRDKNHRDMTKMSSEGRRETVTTTEQGIKPSQKWRREERELSRQSALPGSGCIASKVKESVSWLLVMMMLHWLQYQMRKKNNFRDPAMYASHSLHIPSLSSDIVFKREGNRSCYWQSWCRTKVYASLSFIISFVASFSSISWHPWRYIFYAHHSTKNLDLDRNIDRAPVTLTQCWLFS